MKKQESPGFSRGEQVNKDIDVRDVRAGGEVEIVVRRGVLVGLVDAVGDAARVAARVAARALVVADREGAIRELMDAMDKENR